MKYIFFATLAMTIIAGILSFVIAPMYFPEGFKKNITEHENHLVNGIYIPREFLECETDADCFPGDCCHPKTCVNELAKPDCQGSFCTQECRPGTLDCGCGNCMCQNGLCTTDILQNERCYEIKDEK